MFNKPNFSGVTEAQRLLIAHWYECRTSEGLVPRDAIDPGIVRSTLASLSIVEIDAVGEGRFRIAGSRLRDIFGMDVRGRRVAEIAGTHGECYALGLSSALERGNPVGGVIEGARLHAWLRLPVADEHGDLTMVLCHDELIASRRALETPAEKTASPRFAA
ncbi:MAG: PAS domain-containing protein [Hyphomonas sp.]|uniref:PAS domain-containing protein n=1 Tax=Hyphomonas sp. TaxID=87 RepID=UPI0034A08CE4